MTRLYTYAQAAAAYGVPEETLRKAVASGLLRKVDFGGGYLYLREEDIDAWLSVVSAKS